MLLQLLRDRPPHLVLPRPASVSRLLQVGAQGAFLPPSASHVSWLVGAATTRRRARGGARGKGTIGGEPTESEEDGQLRLQVPVGRLLSAPGGGVCGIGANPESRTAERELELSTLVAVLCDASVSLSCAGVLREAPRQLRVPEHELMVEGLSHATFLLRFKSSARRSSAFLRHAPSRLEVACSISCLEAGGLGPRWGS